MTPSGSRHKGANRAGFVDGFLEIVVGQAMAAMSPSSK